MKNKKYFVAGLSAVAAFVLFFYLFAQYKGTNPTETENSTNEDSSSETYSQETEAKPDTKGEDVFESTPVPSETISIETFQTEDVVTITARLDGYGSGECQLSVSNEQAFYKDTVEIIYQPQYSTCAGFSVPISELGTGLWVIELVASSPNGSGKTVHEQDIE